MKHGNNGILMKIKFIVLFLYMISNLTACSSDTDCFVADSVSLVKAIKVGDLDYFIYLRISGLHEKEAFYELYTNKPIFDACGKSATLAKSDVHIDSASGVVSKLIVDNQQLVIVYAKGKAQEIDYKDVQIEVNALTIPSSRR